LSGGGVLHRSAKDLCRRGLPGGGGGHHRRADRRAPGPFAPAL